MMGRLGYWVVPRIRKTGLENMDIAYGDSITRAEKTKLLKKATSHLGQLAAEFPYIPKLNLPAFEKYYRVEGLENVNREKGGFLLGAHLGNWEWMATILNLNDIKMVGVVRPLDDPRLDKTILAIRMESGIEIIPKKNASTIMFKRLKENYLTAALVDQSPRDNAVPVTFMGEQTWGTAAPAMMALRAKVPIYPMTTFRNEDGVNVLSIHPPVEWEREGKTAREQLVTITQTCQDIVEACIRQHPDQWLWMHNRFKPRPRLEKEWAEKEKRTRSN
jgi:KDO2-lipid IV(A) lauroyltransferase